MGLSATSSTASCNDRSFDGTDVARDTTKGRSGSVSAVQIVSRGALRDAAVQKAGNCDKGSRGEVER